MSRPPGIVGRWNGPVLRVVVAVSTFLGVWQIAFAAEPVSAIPRLAVSASKPLPDSFRKPVPESIDELRSLEERVRSLIPELQAATVGLERGPAQGTGVIVSPDGFVLTAAHVSGPPGSRVRIHLNDRRILVGRSLGRDSETDAGLVKIDMERGKYRTLPVARVGDTDHLKEGDWVIGTGHPGGFDADRSPVIRLGRVIASMSRIIHTDVTLVGGDSGGPLFDLNGRVVGIHSRIGPGAELNFHVPISVYTDNWYWMTTLQDRPVEAGPGGPMLGVDGEASRSGCRVTRVSSNTPADAAGFQKGDVITQLDSYYVRTLEDLVAAVGQYSPGDSVVITYRRGAEAHTARVQLAERPHRAETRDQE